MSFLCYHYLSISFLNLNRVHLEITVTFTQFMVTLSTEIGTNSTFDEASLSKKKIGNIIFPSYD